MPPDAEPQPEQQPPELPQPAPALAVNPAVAQFPNLKNPGGDHGKPTRSVYEIATAMRKNKGDRHAAAKELDIAYTTLCDRISGHPQLKQLFGQKFQQMPSTPSTLEVMERGLGDLPLPENLPKEEKASAVDNLKLISLVSPEDTERLIGGLKAFDFSEKSLEKIRALGDLASNTGRFIAVSLEKTHQNYVVQQFGLMELASDVRRRLLIAEGEKGYIADEETRSYLHKNYVEMVRESGRGVERMLQVAEVITRMLEAASSRKKNAVTKRGWKKVTAAEAQSNGKEAGS